MEIEKIFDRVINAHLREIEILAGENRELIKTLDETRQALGALSQAHEELVIKYETGQDPQSTLIPTALLPKGKVQRNFPTKEKFEPKLTSV